MDVQIAVYHSLRWLLRPFLLRGVAIATHGINNLPQHGAAILVCNHRSDTDGLLITLALPRYIAWMVADYMTAVPITSQVLQLTGMVPVKTEGRPTPSSIKKALQRLRQGKLLGIFPEGEGYIFANDFEAPLAELQSGFAHLAYTAQVPVIPAMIIPKAEKLEPISIPPAVRPHLAQHYDLTNTRSIARYRAVDVRISKAISLKPVAHLDKQEQVGWLQMQTRQAMLNLQR
ncbi:lysophospholipid acyltransferase family protein [Leptothoe spongobia]|uniref:1-acyl-sn-glycerol-3-phosphate acyltransferase n=1 Tax=Leptothoe spongobia TAU-MAC 1115 TaxID=1967444 RepID=A0A947DAD0_9CYAN|nr:lysophospholipid acyltransferase family protein [Leptothoe spongobia]MBT9313847.1 1-acyl-sn-glycerol-3-phosphate acyltransferase [Leptothoe spongobia TAU-MAC 1115]